MEYFKAAALSQTGTLATQEGEIVAASVSRVSLLTAQKQRTPYVNGVLSVTTHRIVWTDSAHRTCIALPLSGLPVQAASNVRGGLGAAKLLLHVGTGVRVEFGGGGRERDLIAEQIGLGVNRREWDRVAERKRLKAEEKSREGDYIARRLGAAGVRDKVAARDESTRKTISEGFASLEQLRHQADGLIEIAGMFRTRSLGEGEEENELLQMMAHMGMESPVTRQSTGGDVALYRGQLARQMAGFLKQALLNVGGVMTLTDAYCLVMRNRATTELVSPQDFHSACALMGGVGGIQIVQLQGGVLALQMDKKDASGAKVLRKMAEERTSITPIDIVQIRHVPIQIATGMLQDAEGLGFLVRDATTDGLRFFPNLFDNFTQNKSAS